MLIVSGFTVYLLVLKEEWRSEYSDHYSGIHGYYMEIIMRVYSPSLLAAPVSLRYIVLEAQLGPESKLLYCNRAYIGII